MTLSDLWRIIKQKPKNSEKKILSKSEEELELKKIELEERKNEAELNRLKLQEAKRIRFKKELEEVTNNIQEDSFDGEEDYEDGEDDDIPPWIAPFIPVLSQKLMGGQQKDNSGITPVDNYSESSQATIYAPPIVSDEELRGFLRSLSKQELKYAKIIPKAALYNMINQKMPMSPQDFERGYQILVTEF